MVLMSWSGTARVLRILLFLLRSSFWRLHFISPFGQALLVLINEIDS